MASSMEILSCALDVGESLLICGAEVARVEDTIGRILSAYGARRADIFTITSSIVVTVDMGKGDIVTQTRRILTQENNLDRVGRLNALSRDICATTPSCEIVRARLADIAKSPVYSSRVMYFVYALVPAAFSIFFGGSLRDALVSGAIGILLKQLINLSRGLTLSRVLISVLYAFAGGAVAMLAVRLGLGDSFDKIAIGDIMLLIPGIPLTNSLRDMLSGDTISGMTRLTQALLSAACVAIGFALAGGWLQ
ncbi:MAG: threonine/serine exporter family protein [Clostridia bacterium]